MSEYILDPYKLFPDICNVRYYDKSRAKHSFQRKECLFFERFSFQQPLSCYRNDLVASTVDAGLPFGPL